MSKTSERGRNMRYAARKTRRWAALGGHHLGRWRSIGRYHYQATCAGCGATHTCRVGPAWDNWIFMGDGDSGGGDCEISRSARHRWMRKILGVAKFEVVKQMKEPRPRDGEGDDNGNA